MTSPATTSNTDGKVRTRRNTAQLLGTLVVTAVIRLVVTAGWAEPAQIDAVKDILGETLWTGLLVFVGGLVYQAGTSLLGRWLPGIADLLEGGGGRPAYGGGA